MPTCFLALVLCALIVLWALPPFHRWGAPVRCLAARSVPLLPAPSASAWLGARMVAGALFVGSMLVVASAACVLSERMASQRPGLPTVLLLLGVALSVAGSLIYLRSTT